MYIDSLTITAIVVFVFALGMFVKHCLVNNCILAADRRANAKTTSRAGDEQ